MQANSEEIIARQEREIARLKSAVEELTVLNELAMATSRTLEVQETLDVIVEKAVKAVKAEQGSILLLTDEPEAPLKTLIRQADRRSRILTYKVGTNITGWVLKHKQPLMVQDLANDRRFKTTEEERREIRSVLCVPILHRAELVGVLTMTNKNALEPFNDSDLRLLSIIAAQSGQLIRNAQLQEEALEKKRLEHELAMARKIQFSLLPMDTPKMAHLEVASYCTPADEVGGDYYDYFHLSEDRLGLLQADVSGHGASAAMVMTMLKGIVHAIAHQFEGADRVLTEVNKIITAIIPAEMFVTMVFLIVDLQNKRVRYSNAGHNPFVLYRSHTKSAEMVHLPGPALGLSSLAAYREETIPLQAGDALILYTDGVTEAFNPDGDMFEEARLLEAVSEVGEGGSSEMVEHIRGKVETFTGGAKQSDDIALIALKAIPEDAGD